MMKKHFILYKQMRQSNYRLNLFAFIFLFLLNIDGVLAQRFEGGINHEATKSAQPHLKRKQKSQIHKAKQVKSLRKADKREQRNLGTLKIAKRPAHKTADKKLKRKEDDLRDVKLEGVGVNVALLGKKSSKFYPRKIDSNPTNDLPTGSFYVKRKVKHDNLHPSHKYLYNHGKTLKQREGYRKSIVRQNRRWRHSKKNTPVYLRKKEKKPKYDPGERNIWENGTRETPKGSPGGGKVVEEPIPQSSNDDFSEEDALSEDEDIIVDDEEPMELEEDELDESEEND